MSDKTASQIEHLIEISKEDFALKASLLEDNIQGDFLVADLLEDIKATVLDIKGGLFEFFEEEQDRFLLQQGMDREEYFRRLENLREQDRDRPTEGGDDGDSDGAIAGSIADRARGPGLLGLAARRMLPLAIVAGAITAGVDYFAEFEEQLTKFKEEGIDPDTAMREAATQAGAKVAESIGDVIVEPIARLGLDLVADELGLTADEVAEFNKGINELSSAMARGAVSIIDSLSSFFGDESQFAAQREDEQNVAELRAELQEVQGEIREAGLDASPGGEIETGLARLDQIASEQQEIAALPFTRNRAELRDRQARIQALGDEQRGLQDRLAPVLEEQRIQSEIQMATEGNLLSQAGYEAGDLQTTGMTQFSQEIPSDQKEAFFEKNLDPLLESAVESGALDRSHVTEVFNATAGVLGPDYSIPVSIKDLDALADLSPAQLEAILINDDLLNNSVLQVGALETSDRKIVEYLYRMKTEGVADPRVNSPVTAAPSSSPVPSPGSEAVTPSPAVSSAVPVGEMSRNMAAQATTPIVIASTQGGDTVNTNVTNSSTTVLGGGAPARSSDIAARRLADRTQFGG